MRCCNNNPCNRHCGNSCGNNCGNSGGNATEMTCYCSRFVDVPMQIVYGQGYTEIDCCEDTLEVLQDISTTLKGMVPNNHGCGCHCGCQCGCCGNCNNCCKRHSCGIFGRCCR